MRAWGILLLVVGLIGVVSGLIILITGLDNPRNMNGAVVAFCILGGVGLLLMIVGGLMSYSSKPAAAAKPVGGRVGPYLADVFEPRSFPGLSYEVLYQTPIRGKNGRPSKLIVRIPAPTPAELKFNREGLFDRLGKVLRIATEVQTGDAEFDAAVYIRGLSDDYAAEFLSSPEVRRGILTVLGNGFSEVRLTGSQFEAEWLSFNPEKNESPRLADNTAAILGEMAMRRPRDFTGNIERDTTYWRCVVLWIALFGFAATAAILFFFPPLRGWEFFAAGLSDFGWNYAIFIVVAAAVLRGTSIAHDRWFPLAFWGIVLMGIGTFGAMEAINALGDPGPIEVRVEPIVSTRTQSSRNGRSYYASVRAWDRPGERIEFSVNSNDYGRIAVHRSKMRLEIGPGRFGHPWVKSQSVLP